MRTRCFQGLNEAYLQTAFENSGPLDGAFYKEHVWWWNVIHRGDLIGSGNAEDGMSLAELKSFEDTIFRYEFMARIHGRYAHGKPWPWVGFDAKFDSVTTSGQIDHEVFNYREFVESSGRRVSSEAPSAGWSGHVGFWFKLDTPDKVIVSELQKLIDRERENQGIAPRKCGRPRKKNPWSVLEIMDQTVNPNCRNRDFDNDGKGDVPRLVRTMLGHLPKFEIPF